MGLQNQVESYLLENEIEEKELRLMLTSKTQAKTEQYLSSI
jgi:hypothetical protein